jgi:cell division protein ZapA
METIQVEIFGQKYSLKGGTDADYIRELAELVDSRMKEVQKGMGTADGYRIAILAALNLADELYRARSQQKTMQRTAEVSLKRLLELTEQDPSS